MIFRTVFCLPILLYYVIYNEEGVDGSLHERKLVKELFDTREYDRTVRPVEYDWQSVNVTYNLALFQLIGLNEKAQTMTISAWIRQKWSDSGLKWDPKDFGGISSINVPPDKVWLPDIVHYNNVNDDFEFGGNIDTLKTRVGLYSNGDVYWLAPIILKGNCKIKVRDFPFDTQHCQLQFGSWAYDMSKIDIDVSRDTMDTAKYMENNEWQLIKTKAIRSQVMYSCCPNPYPDVTFHIYLARRSLFYVLNLVFPIAVITLLTTLSFVLPAESGERISLAVTLMLAVTVFMLLVAETTPATSDAVPLVSVYFILCMVAMFVMIVLLCYINRMYHKKGSDGKMGAWTRRYRICVLPANNQQVILEKLSFIVGIQPREKRKSYNCAENRIKLMKGKLNNSTTPQQQQRHQNGGVGVTLNNRSNKTDGEINGIVLKNNRALHNIDDSNLILVKGENNVNKDLTTIKEITPKTPNVTSDDSKNLDAIIQKLNAKDDDHHFKAEWRIVAMTIDRCLFLFFVVVFMLTTIACFAHTNYIT